ncbi:Methylamine utilisation protein MauE [Bowdeniella nasicola]|uniref:Methylamine utilisation protein MauE n=1 Tax=Bowdeniella nasicola TaxID=208480 RepID=A0A1H3ZP72_9ACTO|nr:MauE/DoxX family redox-associated membrane protein [Bowdeniella nasicola]SEA25579.1 Methylamine utilisation protein MauE [Bowdeniella nasicola]
MALTVATILLAAAFIGSGVGKLRHSPGIGRDIATWRRLGVPRALAKPWAVRALPIVELVLAIALLLPAAFGVAAAAGLLALLIIFTLLVTAAVASGRGTPCHCFGESSAPMSYATVARNLGLLALAGLALVAHLMRVGPWDYAAAHPVGFAASVAVAAAGALAAWGYLAGERSGARDEGVQEAYRQAEAELQARRNDYVRSAVPVLDVQRADGEIVALPYLATEHAVVLVNLTSACHACEEVTDRLAHYRERLDNVVEVVALVADDDDAAAERAGAAVTVVRDPAGRTARAMRLATPSAMLLGTDSYLAGGPVAGRQAIEDFIEDVAAELIAAGMLTP